MDYILDTSMGLSFYRMLGDTAIDIYNLCLSTSDRLRECANVWRERSEMLWLFLRKASIGFGTIGDYTTMRLREMLSRKLELGLLETNQFSYGLQYYRGEQKYTVVFPKNRKVRQIVSATDLEDNDISDMIYRALGPAHNFHGIPTTPQILGLKGIIVRYRGGRNITYSENEVIKLRMPLVEDECE